MSFPLIEYVLLVPIKPNRTVGFFSCYNEALSARPLLLQIPNLHPDLFGGVAVADRHVVVF